VPAVVALAARGSGVRVEALGAADRDTLFRVTSMTKPVIAAATLILVGDGRLGLDEPVDGLLPELAARRVLRRLDGPLDDTVPAHRAITVRDLLTFTMGFGQVLAPPDAYPILRAADDLALGTGPPRPYEMPPPDEWLRRLGTLPLMDQPGRRWHYHTAADVLGVLIARAAGQPLDGFLAERVFAPLGMVDTGFYAADPGRLADGFRTDPATSALTPYDEPLGRWAAPPPFLSGAAGLVSTVDDYLAFGRMLLAGGGALLAPRAVEAMTTDQLTPAQKHTPHWLPDTFAEQGWGFGGAVGPRPGRYGWDGGAGTSWAVDRGAGLVGVLMTQVAWASPEPPPVVRDFWACVYAS
jgi:CubicO group peptidase (beta-lactamase class C family)